MERPTVTVAIVENNGTRAELYAQWLDHVAVRVATTKRRVLDAVDDDLTVAVLDEEFGDGAAETVLEVIRARTRYAQVITTSQDRQRVVPSLAVDNHLTKPIFEEDLRERVEQLARQTVYCEVLERYYRTSTRLTAARKGEDPAEAGRVDELDDRLDDLKPAVIGLRADLDEDDMATVSRLVSRANELPDEADEESRSKYVPPKCLNCGNQWGAETGSDQTKGAVRLGSDVWRCTDCGHIQLSTSAGSARLTRSS